MKTIHSDAHRLHAPPLEFNYGDFGPAFETPQRVEYVLSRVKEAKLGDILPPEPLGRSAAGRIHDAGLLDFIQTTHAEWQKRYGESYVIPTAWVAPGMRRKLPNKLRARLGYYCIDTSTAITAGSWTAASAAVDVAVTAQRLVAQGAPAAFALCRPPGHHAGSDFYGGYCFFNNAAIAAQAFIDGGAQRVAVLDVDFHHGNGTQEIFYRRNDVLFCSLHGHPEDEYPYFSGYQDEVGEGAGEGYNANFPLRPGTAWAQYQPALSAALQRIESFGADALVISLGVDTFENDPISSFKLKSADYLRMGEMIASARHPTLFVMEGGYAVEEIGLNTVNVLTGFESATR
jgi:acetoin utilization deacetylase AcuC-like enzyme